MPDSRRSTLQHRGAVGFAITVGSGLALLAITLALPRGSDIQARVAMSSFGFMFFVLVFARPRGFWEVASVRNWREMFGDRATAAFYLALGLLISVGAWLLPTN
jgi:hypothetical protein